MRHIFTLLAESAANEEKLSHLEHAEDHIVNAGAAGYKHAVNTLNAVHKTLTGQKGGASVTEKYDGSPSVVFGHHPQNGKFFVASKSAFNKTPKINYTPEDIEKNHGHAPGLVHHLKNALEHLPKVTPSKGVFQGDIMHSKDSAKKSAGKVHFTPNTLTYHAGADEADKIKNSKIGIAVHTGYEGKDIHSMKANYTPDLSGFKHHPDVHQIDVGIDKEKAKASYTPKMQAQFQHHMDKAAAVSKTIKPAEYKNIEPHTEHIKTYINKTVREGTSPNSHDLYSHIKDENGKGIAKVKTQKAIETKTHTMNNQLAHVRANAGTIDKVFQIHHHLQQAKDVQNHALSQTQKFKTSIDNTPTKGEGFVAVVNNRPTKIVDRAEFSRQNFLKFKK
jgi:Family of unknown function (DUF6267)